MAGELVASAVVDGLLSKLGSGLWSKLGLLWNFSNDLKDMKSTLQSIEAVLNDAEKRSVKESSVRLWLNKLKAAAYDIEDMFDELQTHNQLVYPPIMALKLKSMRERLDKIAEERSKYNLISSYEKEVLDERKTSSVVFKEDVFGRDQEATQIINRLLMSTTTNESTALSVISIVGIGGLGKTTLAKLIYNDDRTNEFFELRIWVHAVNLEVEKLVEAILSSQEAENRNYVSSFDTKMTKAQEILQGKRYLIVLDDVWSEDGDKWNSFKPILQFSGKTEGKVIVTTRSNRVPSIMGAETTHLLQPLSDDDCSKLFNQRAFGSADAKDNHLASIGKEIVKKCRGIPLTANSLGGILQFKKGKAAWKKVRDSDLWELKESENKIMSPLQLSYQQLPSPLKLCFIYCASYPRAFKLYKDELIQQWIAQRFIHSEDEIEALQLGDEYVNYLLSISFLEEEEIERFRYEDAKTYLKMHDLVYDLARSVAGDEVSILDTKESAKAKAIECRYASVIKCKYDEPSKELGKALPRKVRALHFQESTSTFRSKYFQEVASLPKGIFSYTKCLRVLDFTSCSLSKLPTSIYRLKQLRYLRLPNGLYKVDEEIGKLHNLIYLEISYADDRLLEIPNSIGSLQKLNNLKIVSCYMLESLPESLGNLVKLETLKIRNCDNLRSLPESVGKLVKLETLTIYNCRAIRSLPKSLSNLVNLKILAIGKLSNITLPLSIWELHNLIDLDLSFFDELLKLPDSIGRLQKLKSLKLYGCHNLESLPESLGNLKELRTLDIRMCATLPDELSQAICNMTQLEIQRDEPLELLKFDTSILHLHLVRGDPEQYVVRDVTDAKRINLKERGGSIKLLSYHCGGQKTGRAAEAMLEALQPHQNLRFLQFSNYGGSMFPSWMMSQMELFLPNLVSITLEVIHNCEYLPVLGQLPKLEKIVIENMRKIRRISEELCGARNTTAGASFPSLERLELGHMDELEEWVTAAMAGDDGERGASLFPCLEELTIEWCYKLRRIHSCILPSLKRLELMLMPELEEWVTAAMAGDDGERGASLFPCLEDLTIWECSRLRRIHPCIPPSVRRLFLVNNLHLLTFLDVPEIPLLKHLDIYTHYLDSFPESIRRLTSLETLELGWCKSLTTFPEWLGELSQLQHLVLEECPLINRLPQSIQGLTALKRLRITYCSKSLLKRTRKETGEDWDKISHIDNIEITRGYSWG